MQFINKFTLKPKDPQLNKEFLESRKDDVKEMYTYACFFMIFRLVIGSYNTIVSKDIDRFALLAF